MSHQRKKISIQNQMAASVVMENNPGLPEEKTFRFFVKKHGFKLLNIPSLGMKDVIVEPVKDAKEVRSFLFKRLSNVYISQHKRISQKITVFLGSVVRWCL